MKQLFNSLYGLLFPKKFSKIQSFTYYIPAPPSRKTGYREKQFDTIFYHFINKGFQVLDFKTQVCSKSDSEGFWVIMLVQSTKKSTADLSLDSIEEELSLSSDIEQTKHLAKKKYDEEEEVGGLYYID